MENEILNEPDYIRELVESGPLITTVNGLIGVVTYYGVAWFLLINLLQLG